MSRFVISRASRTVSASAAASSCWTAGSSVAIEAASTRRRKPVRGVRSWCDALATNSRWASSECVSRSVIVLNALRDLLLLGRPLDLGAHLEVAAAHAPGGRGELAQGTRQRAGDEPRHDEPEQQRERPDADQRVLVAPRLAVDRVHALREAHCALGAAAR